MICEFCGKEISDNSEVCEYCGNRIEIPQTNNNDEDNINATDYGSAYNSDYIKIEKCLRVGDFDSALNLSEKKLVLDPTDDAAYFYKICAHFKVSDIADLKNIPSTLIFFKDYNKLLNLLVADGDRDAADGLIYVAQSSGYLQAEQYVLQNKYQDARRLLIALDDYKNSKEILAFMDRPVVNFLISHFTREKRIAIRIVFWLVVSFSAILLSVSARVNFFITFSITVVIYLAYIVHIIQKIKDMFKPNDNNVDNDTETDLENEQSVSQTSQADQKGADK